MYVVSFLELGITTDMQSCLNFCFTIQKKTHKEHLRKKQNNFHNISVLKRLIHFGAGVDSPESPHGLAAVVGAELSLARTLVSERGLRVSPALFAVPWPWKVLSLASFLWPCHAS